MEENRKQQQQFVELLKQKLAALHGMVEITSKLELTGEGDGDKIADEAERFSLVYEQRAVIVAKIQKLDFVIDSLKEDFKDSKDVEEVMQKIREAAKTLVEMDRKNIEASAKLTVFLRDNLKKMKDGKDLNHRYSELGDMTSGHRFDSKK